MSTLQRKIPQNLYSPKRPNFKFQKNSCGHVNSFKVTSIISGPATKMLNNKTAWPQRIPVVIQPSHARPAATYTAARTHVPTRLAARGRAPTPAHVYARHAAGHYAPVRHAFFIRKNKKNFFQKLFTFTKLFCTLNTSKQIEQNFKNKFKN